MFAAICNDIQGTVEIRETDAYVGCWTGHDNLMGSQAQVEAHAEKKQKEYASRSAAPKHPLAVWAERRAEEMRLRDARDAFRRMSADDQERYALP